MGHYSRGYKSIFWEYIQRILTLGVFVETVFGKRFCAFQNYDPQHMHLSV